MVRLPARCKSEEGRINGGRGAIIGRLRIHGKSPSRPKSATVRSRRTEMLTKWVSNRSRTARLEHYRSRLSQLARVRSRRQVNSLHSKRAPPDLRAKATRPGDCLGAFHQTRMATSQPTWMC
jgi:hypothetical protein